MNIPAFYPPQGTNTSIQHANQGHGQQFVFRRQMGLTATRAHLADELGARGELGADGKHRVSKEKLLLASLSLRAAWRHPQQGELSIWRQTRLHLCGSVTLGK